MARFKGYAQDQILLLPPSLRDWLPEDHLVYFISDVVDQVDLSSIYDSYDSTDGGQPPYHPLMMVKLLLYGYSVGVASSRKIEKKTYEDVAFRVLCAGHHPDHDTIAEFRRRHLDALSDLFVQVLEICQEAGLVKLGHIALDSTKLKANASKHKAMSYERMCQREKELTEKVSTLLWKAEVVDSEEDRRYGKGRRGDELPEDLRFHQRRLTKIREAKRALEAEARERALLKSSRPILGYVVNEKTDKVLPKGNVQRNFTDPDSRIMLDSGSRSFIQGYNAQVTVDVSSQIIVAAAVTQEVVDKKQVKPLLEKVKENAGAYPGRLSGDAGYYSEENVRYAEKKGVDAYLTPDKIKHGERPPSIRGRPPKEMSVREKMRRKLKTKRGWAIYSKRKEVAEPVFGQIKAVRGFRQFLLRGLKKVDGEWKIICAAHNLLKLYRNGYALKMG